MIIYRQESGGQTIFSQGLDEVTEIDCVDGGEAKERVWGMPPLTYRWDYEGNMESALTPSTVLSVAGVKALLDRVGSGLKERRGIGNNESRQFF